MVANQYSIAVDLGNAPFGDAIVAVTKALAGEGFGVLTEIDVRQTLDKKLGVPFRPYRILGACNPTLAHRALELEPEIGLLLPCNVVVQDLSGRVEVLIADPAAMFRVVDNPAIAPVATEAEARLRRVAAALGKDSDPHVS